MFGSYFEAEVHRNGLRQLLKLRRETHEPQMSRLLEKIIHW